MVLLVVLGSVRKVPLVSSSRSTVTPKPWVKRIKVLPHVMVSSSDGVLDIWCAGEMLCWGVDLLKCWCAGSSEGVLD